MKGSTRDTLRGTLCALALLFVLGGCASTPAPETGAPALVVRREGSNPNDSLISTRVSSARDTVAGTFATSKTSATAAPAVARLESSWTRALNESEQLQVGDTVSDAGSWGNPVRFAGLQLSSQRELRSDVVANNRLAMAGIASLPTAADVLFAASRPSDYTLPSRGITTGTNLKVAGTNAISLQAQDATGRTLRVNQTLIPQTELADPGCGRFSFGAGKVRENYALTDDSYGAWFGNSRFVCGSRSGLTLEGQSEYLDGFGGNVGMDLAKKVGIGTAAVGVGWSDTEQRSGWLARFAFDHSNPWFDFNLRARTNSAEFRRVAMLSMTEVASQQAMASVGMKLGEQSNVALIYATETLPSLQQPSELWALSQRTRLSAADSLSITAKHALSGDPLSLYVSFTRAFGRTLRPLSILPADYQLVRTPRLTQ